MKLISPEDVIAKIPHEWIENAGILASWGFLVFVVIFMLYLVLGSIYLIANDKDD